MGAVYTLLLSPGFTVTALSTGHPSVRINDLGADCQINQMAAGRATTLP